MDCPLLAYLAATGEAPYIFADRAGVSRATVYSLLNGSYGDLKWSVLCRIQLATTRRVTVQMLSDWLEARETDLARSPEGPP